MKEVFAFLQQNKLFLTLKHDLTDVNLYFFLKPFNIIVVPKVWVFVKDSFE